MYLTNFDVMAISVCSSAYTCVLLVQEVMISPYQLYHLPCSTFTGCAVATAPSHSNNQAS